MWSGVEEGSYLRLIDCCTTHRLLYHSTLDSRVEKRKKKGEGELAARHGGRADLRAPLFRVQTSGGRGVRVWGLGFGVWGVGFRVQGSGLRLQASGFGDQR